MAVTIRKAVKSDLKTISEMIQELADFGKTGERPGQTIEDMERDGGFNGEHPLYICFVAETIDGSNPSLIGYALCYNSYSTRFGKNLFLEDLYVRQNRRTHGIGRLLMTKVINHAKDTQCSRVEFQVLDWNPARHFYEKLKAVDSTVHDGWHYYRINKEDFDSFTDTS